MKNKFNLRGLGKVYGFTLKQMLKTKANIALMVIIIVISLASGPILGLVSGAFGGAKEPGQSEEPREVQIERKIVLENKTGLELTGLEESAGKAGLALTVGSIPENKVDEENIYLVLAENEGALTLTPEVTAVDPDEAFLAADRISAMIYEGRLERLGITESKLTELNKFVDFDYSIERDSDGEEFSEAAMDVQMVCSIIVMMISILSAVFIIRSVLEEKTSKLVETMTVSVDPLSMIFGKILASVTYTFIQLGTVVVCALISNGITSAITGKSVLTDLVERLLEGIGNFGIVSVIVLIVSVLLGCLTFGLVSGLSGVSCSSMDDASSANGASLLIVMICYMVSIIVSTMNAPVWLNFIPFLSIFVTPAQFVLGKANIFVVLGSWLVQLAVVAALALICSAVYRELILYKGERYKFTKVIKMGIQNLKKGGKQNEKA